MSDEIQEHIEWFFTQKKIPVIVEHRNRGYSMFRFDTGEPLARLRRIPKEDYFEVLWWSHKEKWDHIGDWGGIIQPLDEALEYILKDPMGCFWYS